MPTLHVSVCQAIALGAAFTAAACVPIAHTVVTLPPVFGEVRLRSGAPAAGQRIGIVAGGQDAHCSAATVTTTDSAGRFSLPVQTKRERWVILLPLEQFGTAYTVCVPDAANTLVPAYHGLGTRHATGPAERIFCVTGSASESAACAATLHPAATDTTRPPNEL